MGFDYDAFYRENRHGLGAPNRHVVRFFDGLAPGRVLDVGCGQGRDALFIARLGHQVVGVDLSPAGIADLTGDAAAEGLDITGIVADIRDFVPPGSFDVILIDRTLHMLPEAGQLSVLAGLLAHVRPQGWLLIADESRNITRFRKVLLDPPPAWDLIRDDATILFAHRI